MRPAVWISPLEVNGLSAEEMSRIRPYSTAGFFMANEDARRTRQWLEAHVDAVRIENAYEIVAPELLLALAVEGGLRE